jgi:hypothetical protein
MSTSSDVDETMQRAGPVLNQHAHEIQPFGHPVELPIALSEAVCKESVENLNQLLADTMTLREMQAWFVAEHAVDTPLVRAR